MPPLVAADQGTDPGTALPALAVPVFCELTSGTTNDLTVAKNVIPIETGVICILDLGYDDVGFPPWSPDHGAWRDGSMACAIDGPSWRGRVAASSPR